MEDNLDTNSGNFLTVPQQATSPAEIPLKKRISNVLGKVAEIAKNNIERKNSIRRLSRANGADLFFFSHQETAPVRHSEKSKRPSIKEEAKMLEIITPDFDEKKVVCKGLCR